MSIFLMNDPTYYKAGPFLHATCLICDYLCEYRLQKLLFGMIS